MNQRKSDRLENFKMDPFSPCKSALWQRPQDVIKIKKIKQKKRLALERSPASPTQDRRLAKRSYSACFSEIELKKDQPKWQTRLCLDWSLKNSLRVVSSKPFGWANHLKTSEESSGVSAFVRCINIEPQVSFHGFPQNSALDTSLGAQFHQCCLYWQHPNLPGTSLFPRTDRARVNKGSFLLKADSAFFNDMHLEWIEALRSIFQLLRARQCPYFYVCGNNLTILFCAAGIQGNEQIQAYVTPSTRGFREALKSEGINFTLPYHINGDSQNSSAEGGELEKSPKVKDQEHQESDEEADKWLDEIGISQDISYSSNKQANDVDEEKSKSTLVMITGSDTLSFFNFLVNSKNFLVSPIGAFAGIPPTIIAPVTFHGASLKSLVVTQTKVRNEDNNESNHSIEMTGPILPHVIHMLSSLLNKNVQNFKIVLKTFNSSIPFNIKSGREFAFRAKPSAFELENLSDCGLKKDILETFCCCDNCDTIKNEFECCNSLFQWN